MKDFDNNPLQIGDIVAYLPPYYRNMIKGRVVDFTPKKVRIERILSEEDYARYRERNYPIPTDLRETGYIVKLNETSTV